eukprot:CAMPEP_0178520296 /NCGR_PEP_ID=MMETSP0696-20121128/27318_1 /TAXON_ID=265572 /ORGANISM="Extubocellulus spinifer, Strain CCMP396" /LENGTH=154 /DNA_ID=CAMNT_0020151123 /DNA_START=314 /DNA_END=778 /DNA_ORIENTATION=-
MVSSSTASSKNIFVDGASEKKRDDSSKMTMTYGLKKTIGLSKSSAKESRDPKEGRVSKIIAPERKSLGRPPVPRKGGTKLRSISEKRDDNEAEEYGHGVVDLWLEQNAHRVVSPPRRRPMRRSKNKFKAAEGDTSVITESTLKAGNFLPWELGH